MLIQLFELHDKVCRLLTWVFVSFALKAQLCAFQHSWSNENINLCLFLFDSVSIKSDDLVRVTHSLLCATIEFFQCHFDFNRDILHLRHWRLIESTESSAEHTSFKFEASIITNVIERVHLQEENVEDLVAVILVLVSSSENYIDKLVCNGLPPSGPFIPVLSVSSPYCS